jgi:predicted unusual protein kinase regulating ubiquinone biosynthesis (AarF/ABC1/UbiB family)
MRFPMTPNQTRVLAATVLAAAVGRWVSTGRLFRKGGPAAPVALPSIDRVSRTTELIKVGAVGGASFAAHQVKRAVASEEKKEELDRAYELKSAEQVTQALGNMKGVLMKLGQMASFLNDGFPPQVREQLATLQSDAPPMSSDLAASVIEEQLGKHPDELFASWERQPIASASIGQVHRAVLHDGRKVAVKVQYPGVEKAISADLSNTALLTQMLGVLFKGLDVGPFVAELKARVNEELDYELEAARQRTFVGLFAGHPTIVVPNVIDEFSSKKVLVTELSDGVRYQETEHWTQDERNLAAETIYRFVFRSFNRHKIFNGDPHPGNYLFEKGGPLGIRVVFLDFGLVKEFTTEEMEIFWRMIRFQVIDHDAVKYRQVVEEAGLLVEGAPFTTDELMDYLGFFYHPVMEDKPFTYTSSYAREALKRTFDVNGEHTEKMKWFNLPPSFIVLNRIQWGLNAVLAGLEGTANWRAISGELWPFTEWPAATELGRLEAAWVADRETTTS